MIATGIADTKSMANLGANVSDCFLWLSHVQSSSPGASR